MWGGMKLAQKNTELPGVIKSYWPLWFNGIKDARELGGGVTYILQQ